MALFQKTESSGIIFNAGSTDWCSSKGWNGPDGLLIRKITSNCIEKLLNDEDVFSD
jgi:hypothetical protein